jgi:hypothetical protein
MPSHDRIIFPTLAESEAQSKRISSEMTARFAELEDHRREDHPGRVALSRLATIAIEQRTTGGGAALARLLCWLDGRASPFDDTFALGMDVARLDAKNRADWFTVYAWFSITDTRQPVEDQVNALYEAAKK